MRIKNNRGQVIIEYVLLLIIVVSIAAIIISGVVSRDESEPGFLIKAWNELVITIGNDCVDNCD